jgi:hypothetical protein
MLASLAAVLAGSAGCDTRFEADPAQRFLLDRLEVDMAEARRARDAHTDPSFPCRAILVTVPSFKNAGRETRGKLESAKAICRDGAQRFAEAQVTKLEAARRATKGLVEECFNLEHALDVLVTLAPDGPSTATLASQRKALCP